MPLLLLFLVFIVVPLAELYVLIQVGSWIGVLPTIGLLLLDSILGTMLMRAQGRSVWRRFSEAVQAGRAPAREVLDGGLVLLGGAFLLTPGFLTDIIGVALLLPPSRALFRTLLARRLQVRMVSSLTGRRGPRGGAGGWSARSGAYDVDGTAHDVDPAPKPAATPTARLGGPRPQ